VTRYLLALIVVILIIIVSDVVWLRPVNRFDATLTPPPAADLTPEEQVNSGQHAYQVACAAFAGCQCAEGGAGLRLTFLPEGALVEIGQRAILYRRVQPNVYQATHSRLTTTLTFYQNGFVLEIQRDSRACVVQTFTLP
jgi:hypothetical protein